LVSFRGYFEGYIFALVVKYLSFDHNSSFALRCFLM